MLKRTLTLISFLCVGFVFSIRADVITDWNQHAVTSVVTAGSARPAGSGSIDIAMAHLAMYDAVQAIERKFEPYYVDIPGASGSPIAAAAAAAHDVLAARFPAQAAALNVIYLNYLAANGILPTDPGITVGQTAAAGILRLRACDGSFPSPAPPPFVGSMAIGQWRPIAPQTQMNPGPWQGQVMPFLLTRPFQFRSQPPPELTSQKYAKDYNEVRLYGSALNTGLRNPEQTDMAYFWAGNTGVAMNGVLRHVSQANVNSIADSSRLFALATAASADTLISTWNDKVFYNLWRPITAIRDGHLDGNPNTPQDGTWDSLIPSPPYPDYGSGANAYSFSTMQSLIRFFGPRRIDFTVTTTNTGPTSMDTREYRSFNQVIDEVVDARVFLGIHFRFADEASRDQGIKVANFGFENYFRRYGLKGHAARDEDPANY